MVARFAAICVAVLVMVGLVSCSGENSTSSPTPPSGAAKSLSAEDTAKIDDAAQAQLDNGITGVIVSVSDPVKGSYLKAYGDSDTVGTPMTADMHYRIASVSKTFTAHAILQLVDQKKVNLQDPIAKYISDLPNGQQITVGDLLAMRGGVYNLTDDPGFLAQHTADPTLPGWTPDNALQIIRAHARDFSPPNRKTVYSNSEYILLGYVIEKATGQTAQQYITSLIGTLGLAHTSFPTDNILPAPFTHGYVGTGSMRDVTLSNPRVPWTAGAMISTVPDMTRYAAQLATGAGLSPQTAQLRQTWESLNLNGRSWQYGLGIAKAGDWVGHSGSIFGYSGMVFHSPRQQATVVVMVNAYGGGTTSPSIGVWTTIVKQLYPGSLPAW